MLGRRRRRVARNRVQRWATKGYAPRGWTGPRLVLPTVIISGTRWTMPAWVEAFELERARMGTRPPAGPTRRMREAGHRRACERLRAQGLMVSEGGAA